MNILLVYAHPEGESFNKAIREAFLRGIKTAGHKINIIDLYKDKFNPVLSESELKGGQEPDVKKYQHAITKADWMVFIYPVWWFRAPAILEGWFDRVLTVHFAFRYKKICGNFGIPVGMLPCKKALVINTYGSPGWVIEWICANIPWRRLKQGVLKICGVKTLIHFPCYASAFVSDKKREKWLSKIERIVATLA